MIKMLLAVLCAGGMLFGQDKGSTQPTRFYKLDFTVKEIDGGKVINQRSYMLPIVTPAEAGQNGEIRAGEKIPYSGSAGPSLIDVGVNIDCRNAREIGDLLSLNVSADISSVGVSSEKGSLPLIRETKMNSFVLVPHKKATLIFSSDEPSSKGQLQIELTATPLN